MDDKTGFPSSVTFVGGSNFSHIVVPDKHCDSSSAMVKGFHQCRDGNYQFKVFAH